MAAHSDSRLVWLIHAQTAMPARLTRKNFGPGVTGSVATLSAFAVLDATASTACVRWRVLPRGLAIGSILYIREDRKTDVRR